MSYPLRVDADGVVLLELISPEVTKTCPIHFGHEKSSGPAVRPESEAVKTGLYHFEMPDDRKIRLGGLCPK